MTSMCMFTPSSDGGHARYTWELLHALAAEGDANALRFELITSQDLVDQFKCDTYRIHTILPPLWPRRTYRNRFAWIIGRVTHYARREFTLLKWLKTRPDVAGVHFQEWTPWLAAPLFRRVRKMGKKIFYTCHNVIPHKYPRLVPKFVMNHWIRSACRLADGLFVHTDMLASELSDFLGHKHPPIKVVPHGIWTVNDVVRPPEVNERLKWKRLLFFGTIRENKGLDLLLRASEFLPEYSITVAGGHDEREYYHQTIVPLLKQLREKGAKVELIDGYIPDEKVGELFATHSAVIMPYTRGFVAQSGVVFMALTYQIPVVASEVGGLRDLFNQFKIGASFRDETPRALAGAIRTLFNDTPTEFLVNQIREAKQHFSWASSAQATIAAYKAADVTSPRIAANDASAAPLILPAETLSGTSKLRASEELRDVDDVEAITHAN